MSIILVPISEIHPEKNLEKTIKLKGFLSQEKKEEIIEEISKIFKDLNIDDYMVDIVVEIELKKYKTNDSKNS